MEYHQLTFGERYRIARIKSMGDGCRAIARKQELEPKGDLVIKSVTLDNGTEFHGYAELARKHDAKFYFARPYHSWERGHQREHQRPDTAVPAQGHLLQGSD